VPLRRHRMFGCWPVRRARVRASSWWRGMFGVRTLHSLGGWIQDSGYLCRIRLQVWRRDEMHLPFVCIISEILFGFRQYRLELAGSTRLDNNRICGSQLLWICRRLSRSRSFVIRHSSYVHTSIRHTSQTHLRQD
jgi:hypothetical protein